MLRMKLKAYNKKEKYTKATYQCLSKIGQLSNREKDRKEGEKKMKFIESKC